MSKVCIGVYICNDPVPVYMNSDTGEIYYNDELSGDYMLVGFNVGTIPDTDVVDDPYELVNSLPEGMTGIVYDGKHKWFLSADGTAYRVSADAVDASSAETSVGYDDTLEYDDADEDDED